jgi:hypothetical protein
LFTRYCSKQCNSRHYKQLAKEEKAKFPNAQLTSTVTSPTETLVSMGTYYSIVLTVINEAIQHRHIHASVTKNVNPIKRAELKTEALSAKELTNLAEAECDCVTLKKGFLVIPGLNTIFHWNKCMRNN